MNGGTVPPHRKRRKRPMIRKTLLGIAAAAALMGAAVSSANAGFTIAVGEGGHGWGHHHGWGHGWGGGYGYGYGGWGDYDDCDSVIAGYRMKTVWFHGIAKFVRVPIWRTRCF